MEAQYIQRPFFLHHFFVLVLEGGNHYACIAMH